MHSLTEMKKINYKCPKQKTKQSKAEIMKTMFLANEFKKKFFKAKSGWADLKTLLDKKIKNKQHGPQCGNG